MMISIVLTIMTLPPIFQRKAGHIALYLSLQ